MGFKDWGGGHEPRKVVPLEAGKAQDVDSTPTEPP